MNVRYRVELSQAERGELTAMLSKGKRAARKLKRAQILLAADAGCSDEAEGPVSKDICPHARGKRALLGTDHVGINRCGT